MHNNKQNDSYSGDCVMVEGVDFTSDTAYKNTKTTTRTEVQVFADGLDFYDTKTRHAFIFKVYSILDIQLMVTTLGVMLFYYIEPLNHFMKHTETGWILAICSAVLAFILVIILVCIPSVSRKSPGNLILLALFTLAETYGLAFTCVFYDIKAILGAFITTAVIVVLLTIFAMQTKIDFTSNAIGIGLTIALFCCIIVSMLNTFVFHCTVLSTVVSCICVVIFCGYIVYDTQLIVGGKHRNQFSEQDYVIAALSLYLDIICLFQELLRLFGN